jgi:osmotically-inducible protein OsmY
MTSEVEMRAAVLRELGRERQLDGAAIEVAVDRRVVTLAGLAPTYAQVLAAQAAAHRAGVALDVACDLHVRCRDGLAAPDTRIARAVRRALMGGAASAAGHIRSTVAGGWVTLEGTVDRWAQREAAGQAVRGLAGVRGVTNRLAVRVPTVRLACTPRVPQTGAGRRSVGQESDDDRLTCLANSATLRGRP